MCVFSYVLLLIHLSVVVLQYFYQWNLYFSENKSKNIILYIGIIYRNMYVFSYVLLLTHLSVVVF